MSFSPAVCPLPALNATQAAIVANLVAAFEALDGSATASVSFQALYDSFIEDEDNFSFEECESICCHYGWA